VAFLAVGALAAKTSVAPVIPGWSWLKHPNTLLVAYPKGWCGCGLNTVLDSAHVEHQKCVIVTDAGPSAIKRITAYHSGVRIIVSSAAVHDLVGSSKFPTFWWVRYGLVTRSIENHVPQEQELNQ
jgi:hypothetical protein